MPQPIKFLCPRWGFEDIAWDSFLQKVKAANYAGIEWFPFAKAENYAEVLDLLKFYELDFAFVMAVIKPYQGFEKYIVELEDDLQNLMQIRNTVKQPLFVSAQTGREFFNDDQIAQCLAVCSKIEDAYQTPIYQETHRNKWSFAAHRVGDILSKTDELNLTLDVSHWFCVSESYLEDQQQAVNLAIKNTKHIHARVGHSQGSQVYDPAMPIYAEALNAHLKIWDEWVSQCRAQNQIITFTPEFGPPPYLTMGDRTTSATDEQWRLNLWMKDFLTQRYS